MVLSRVLRGLSLLCCPHPSLLFLYNHSALSSLPSGRCVFVYLCCVFLPPQGFGLLTLQTLSLITEHSRSLRALRKDLISLCSSFSFFPNHMFLSILYPLFPFFLSSLLMLFCLSSTDSFPAWSLDPSLVISAFFGFNICSQLSVSSLFSEI